MSLSSVIQIAQNSLSNMTRRTGVLARNINDAGNESYARRDLQTITLLSGAQTSSIRRSTDLRLERAAVDANSANSAQQILASRLETLNGILAGDGAGLSVSDRLTALHDSLQTYSGAPDNNLLGEAVVATAKDVVAGLREATTVLQDFRTGIDKEIGQAVSDLNTLLSEFQDANNEIRQGTMLGRDVNDALDRRGALMNDIAKIVPVSSFIRSNNDMVLLTASGATLFETEPRVVSFTPQTAMSAGSSGNPVLVDVVKLSLGSTPNSSAAGSLDALLRLRDGVAPSLQKQMDEIARSLVSDFAETDVTGGSLAPLQGLFAWTGGPAFPTAGLLVDGLAGNISINAAYDPDAGGSITRLRDGGANGAAYLANPSGYAAFADRLINLATGFDRAQPFDAGAGLGSSQSLLKFANLSNGWFAGVRSSASRAADLADAKQARLTENLSNITGVNIDTEMAKLGELEQGYEASARLLRAADEMLQNLLDAVG